MQLIGTLISVGVTLAVVVGVVALLVTTLLGAVRGPTERAANRLWVRGFMLLVSAGLATILIGLLSAVADMVGIV